MSNYKLGKVIKENKSYFIKLNNNNKITVKNNYLEKINLKEKEYIFVKKIDERKYISITNPILEELENEVIKNQENINNTLKLNKFTHCNYLLDSLNSVEFDRIRKDKKVEMDQIKKEWSKNYDFLEFNFKLLDKMVIGLGDTSIHETSILLHHIYGIPYIPGQAIKGIIRSYIINEKYDGSEDKALEFDEFINFFGGEKKGSSGLLIEGKSYQGNVIFFDAFPENNDYRIEKDIMTPHYKEYYESGDKAPTDDMIPVPIEFLVVKDAEFKTHVAIKKGSNVSQKEVKNLFFEVFEFMGIGAKTALGYGFINVDYMKNKFKVFKNKLKEEKKKRL